MAKKRAFISFDFDHDKDLRGSLVEQAKQPDSPFRIKDGSVQEPITEKWKQEARALIRRADLIIVICGEHTHDAAGVTAEVTIVHEENKPYFLLKGRRYKTCKKPMSALRTDKIYRWTLENLRRLINGERYPDVSAVQ